MSIQAIGIITLLLAIACLYRDEAFAIVVFTISTLLGSAAALILTGIGASIQPAHLLLGLLSIKIFGSRAGLRNAARAMVFPREGYWLLCTLLYGGVGAIFFPRLLAGQISVNAIGAGAYGASFTQVPFGPTSGNITQTIYFAGDAVCFLACSAFAAAPNGIKTLTKALLAYSVANILFAVLDLTTFWTGTTFLLEFMRNSTYVIFTEAMVGNLKRIIGSFTEASSFAYASMGALAFNIRLWLNGTYTILTLPVAIISLLFLLLSTSTTAYVALPVYFLIFYLEMLWNIAKGRANGLVLMTAIFVPLLVVVILLAVTLDATASNALAEFFNGMVLQKSSSQSGMERGRYNWEAFVNFGQTLGIGAGIGSVRASSLIFAVLANLGIPGGLTYGAFIGIAILAPDRAVRPPYELSVRSAARSACLALLVAASLSGALIDLGLPFFIFAALACARPGVATFESSASRRRALAFDAPQSSVAAASNHGYDLSLGVTDER